MMLLKHLTKLCLFKQTFRFATKAQELVRSVSLELQKEIMAKNKDIGPLLDEAAKKIMNIPPRDREIFYKLVLHMAMGTKIPLNTAINFGNKYYGEFPHLQIENISLQWKEAESEELVGNLMDQAFNKLKQITDPNTKSYYEQLLHRRQALLYVMRKDYKKAFEHFDKTLDELTKILNSCVEKYSKRLQQIQNDTSQTEVLQIQANGLKTLLKSHIDNIGSVSRQAFKVAEMQSNQVLAVKYLNTGLYAFSVYPAVKQTSTDYMTLQSLRLFFEANLKPAKMEPQKLASQLRELLALSKSAVKKVITLNDKMDACACVIRTTRLIVLLSGKRAEINKELNKTLVELKKNISENDWSKIGKNLEEIKDRIIKTEELVLSKTTTSKKVEKKSD